LESALDYTANRASGRDNERLTRKLIISTWSEAEAVVGTMLETARYRSSGGNGEIWGLNGAKNYCKLLECSRIPSQSTKSNPGRLQGFETSIVLHLGRTDFGNQFVA
jgi:hypothetical protein